MGVAWWTASHIPVETAQNSASAMTRISRIGVNFALGMRLGLWPIQGMTHDFRDEDWAALVPHVAAAIDLEGSARSSGALRRRREVRTADTLLRLALGYGPGGLSLRQAAAWADLAGLAELSGPALMKRLRNAADWLGALAGALLARNTAAATEGVGERPIRLVDGSVIRSPGRRTTDWRLHVAYDPVAQRFTAIELTDTSGAERLERVCVTPGEIRIGDRGDATRPEGVLAMTAGPGDYVVRVGWRGLHWLDPAGGRFDVLGFLDHIGVDGRGEAEVRVGRARGRFTPVPARLIALRLPPEQVEKACRRARKASAKAGDRVHPGTLKAAGYLLLLTSLPAGSYPAERVAALYRLRWQVELAFKRLKSILHLDRLPAKDPDLARAWLYAHLIAALLIDGMVQGIALDAPPCGRRTRAPGLALAPGDELGPSSPRGSAWPSVPDAPHCCHPSPGPPPPRSTPKTPAADAGLAS